MLEKSLAGSWTGSIERGSAQKGYPEGEETQQRLTLKVGAGRKAVG